MNWKLLWSAALGLTATAAMSEDAPALRVHGGAWIDVGRIMQASDTLIHSDAPTVVDLNGNGLQSMGGQFTFVGDIGDNFEGALGFGTFRTNHTLGKGQPSWLSISLFQNFITQSRLTYYAGEKEAPTFSATIGSFPYKYNRDVKNLGMYLLRGPVYPGLLMGGFQDYSVDSTRSSILGARLHQSLGAFSHDLILNSERDIPPTFDWSLAYVAKVRLFDALELGGGVNFYRLLAYNKDTRTPGKLSDAELGFKRHRYIEVDSSGPTPDTTFFTHQGTKLMGMFSIDFKPLFGIESMGANDLKLYGEAAVIGLKDYGTVYNDINRRIPLMVGFNLPAFGWLDLLSIEVERYTAKYRNDLARVGNNNVVADWTTQPKPVPSPKPVEYEDYGINPDGTFQNSSGQIVDVKGTAMDKENLTMDDIKWSINVEKSINRRIRFIAQLANDHYRPRPIATGLIFANGGTAEAFSAQSDMYFMLRVGYFF